MRRIFPDFAYSDQRIARCHWSETVSDDALKRAAPEGGQAVDVAIIGAGFTGLSAGLHLAQAGVSVAVLDARFPGWGASGRNGGFCCLGGAGLDDAAIDKQFGKAARLDWRQAEKTAVGLVAQLLQDHVIEADNHSQGETVVAHKVSAARWDRQVAACEENYGVTPQVIDKHDLAAQGMAGPFHGGLTIPIGFGLNPRKYLAGLLGAAEAAGASVFGDAPVEGLERQGDKWRLTLPGGAMVLADKVILATNGYSSEDLPEWLAGRYMPAQSSVIVTRPLSAAEQEAQGWTSAQMGYDTRSLLHYFRLMPDGRFLFGMRGGLRATPRSDRAIQRLIRRDFEAMFPAWRHVETPHYWTGMVCLSGSLAPFAGPVPDMPGLFAGLGFHGNGVAMGTFAGKLLAGLVQGETPELYPELMQKPPAKFPLGRFRRALMFPAYAAMGLADRFG